VISTFAENFPFLIFPIVLLGWLNGVTGWRMRSLTIKLEPEQVAWLEQQSHALKRSKGDLVRELITERQTTQEGSLGQALADLCGCLEGKKDLSTRSLKGYGRS
jgi:hypothetical protein